MRYLGIVQKKGMMGNQAELYVFAQEEREYQWRDCKKQFTDRGLIEKISRYAQGEMLLLEINDLGQAQRIEPAEKQLLPLLQGFGRQLESFRNQAQEIETWRESLQYQAEALNTREQEWQNREHELLTEISELRENGPGTQAFQDLQQHWVELEAERQQLLYERQQLEENLLNPSCEGQDPLLIAQIQTELAQVHAQLEAREGSYQNILKVLAQSIDQDLSPLTEQLEQLGIQLAQYNQEQETLEHKDQELHQRALALSAQQQSLWIKQGALDQKQHLLHMEREAYQQIRSPIVGQQEQLQALIDRCGGPVAIPQLSPEQLDQRRRQWSEQQREYLQRANLVRQQDEELKLQEQQLAELQQRLEDASADEIDEIEEEIEFLRQSGTELRESVSRQKVNLAQQELLLNRERDFLAQLVASFEDKAPPNPNQALIPELNQILSTSTGLIQQTQGRLTALEEEMHILQQEQQLLTQQKQARQIQQEQLQTEQAQYAQERNILELQRSALEIRCNDLYERKQILEGLQATLNGLQGSNGHGGYHPVAILAQLSSQLAALS